VAVGAGPVGNEDEDIMTTRMGPRPVPSADGPKGRGPRSAIPVHLMLQRHGADDSGVQPVKAPGVRAPRLLILIGCAAAVGALVLAASWYRMPWSRYPRTTSATALYDARDTYECLTRAVVHAFGHTWYGPTGMPNGRPATGDPITVAGSLRQVDPTHAVFTPAGSREGDPFTTQTPRYTLGCAIA
jgi:hypothetical protein